MNTTPAPPTTYPAAAAAEAAGTYPPASPGAVANPSYSVTMRLHTTPDNRLIGAIATAIANDGGVVTGVDVAESRTDRIVVDVTCSAAGAAHAASLEKSVGAIDGVSVHKVSDRTFLVHLGGKIDVVSRVALKNRDDLALAYTPGVGKVCRALAEHPEDIPQLTVKGNSVAIVTDGSAVLGLGDIGPGASLPVMEGKAALFKRLADVNAWPIALDTHDVDEIVNTVRLIAPGFGGIHLEDIAAPRCFEIEARLNEILDIPVYHDDQHGTAIVVLAALRNALRVVGKNISEIKVALAGAGASGTAIANLLMTAGVTDIVAWDREGCLTGDDASLPPAKRELASRTNPRGVRGELIEALRGADVFIGVSSGGVLQAEWLTEMADDAIVFALANPEPEIDPNVAAQYAAIVATGGSDYPNQINNVLAFPGVFRGLLDARATGVAPQAYVRAADALAAVVTDDELNPSFIIPNVFDPAVPRAVAAAISS